MEPRDLGSFKRCVKIGDELVGFKKGEGGRPKGVKNIKTFNVEEIASRFALDPFEVLMMVVNNDWKGLGFDAPAKISYTNAGIEFEEPHVKMPERVAAAGKASRYLYAEKKAVELSTGETGIKIEIVDYSTKVKE
jgi:hypothetical protein